MDSSKLKHRIMSNSFVDGVRIDLRFDDAAFADLVDALTELATALRGSQTLDRELAAVLYSIPLMVRNSFLAISGQAGVSSPIIGKLEDAWLELDALVMECLVESGD